MSTVGYLRLLWGYCEVTLSAPRLRVVGRPGGGLPRLRPDTKTGSGRFLLSEGSAASGFTLALGSRSTALAPRSPGIRGFRRKRLHPRARLALNGARSALTRYPRVPPQAASPSRVVRALPPSLRAHTVSEGSAASGFTLARCSGSSALAPRSPGYIRAPRQAAFASR
jgi:hypothetical protein